MRTLKRILLAALLIACSRTTATSTNSTMNDAGPSATRDAGSPFIVRIHRYGGGPRGLDHTLEVSNDGSARLVGYDTLWCNGKERRGVSTAPIDVRITLEEPVIDELRRLAADPEVTSFRGAAGPAKAPESDGVAAEVVLPPRVPILVDGVREVSGKMGRLLDLDRELAKRYGSAATCP